MPMNPSLGASTGNMLSVPGQQTLARKKEDGNAEEELWDEVAYARALTPIANLRQNEAVLHTNRESEQREIELKKRLSKFCEKRNERLKANKGFFLRDKDIEHEESKVEDKQTTSVQKRRFNEKFKEALDEYVHPNIHVNVAQPKNRHKQGGDQLRGLFPCKQCKPTKQGRKLVFTSFLERNFHDSLAHNLSGLNFTVECSYDGCHREFNIWDYPEHVESKHNQTISLECPINCCDNLEIQSFHELWAHVVRAKGGVKYVCPICLHDRYFFNSHQLSKHLQDQHNVEKVNICVLCSMKKEPQILSNRMRAAVFTVKCLMCAKKGRTGLTSNYLLENAMTHLLQFHCHVGYLCLNCLTIRSVKDEDHLKKCLHCTKEGLNKEGKDRMTENFLFNAVVKSFGLDCQIEDGKSINIGVKVGSDGVSAKMSFVKSIEMSKDGIKGFADQTEWEKTKDEIVEMLQAKDSMETMKMANSRSARGRMKEIKQLQTKKGIVL